MTYDYIIALDEEEYSELKELAQINKELDKILVSFQHDDHTWHTERTRMEYCMLLLQIKKLKKKSKIVSKLMSLGHAQDNEFGGFLNQVEKDLSRYCQSEYEAH